MQATWNTDVLSIMERTLNYIDTRLVNHGRRVAHIVHQLLWYTGRYSRREMRDICIAALLHDIGAYKTEEIDRMVGFETQNTWDHSIYGQLFFKYFSPLERLADVILHHHTPCTALDRRDPSAWLAQVFFVADRLDVFYRSGITNRAELLELLERERDSLYLGEVLDLVTQQELVLPVTDELVMGDSEISRVLRGIPLSYEENMAYLKMIVAFIDFRSHQTLSHTIATTSISDTLAELLQVDASSRSMLIAGSWLHDIGKTGIPLRILEKPGPLTDEEMATIQLHVSITDEILRDSVPDEVRLIAAHHHEKLDGSGYPRGLREDNLSVCARIVVVADIFSALCGVRSYKPAFPKERVIAILEQMRDDGLLDPDVVGMAIDHFDLILAKAEEDADPYDEKFALINQEHMRLRALHDIAVRERI